MEVRARRRRHATGACVDGELRVARFAGAARESCGSEEPISVVLCGTTETRTACEPLVSSLINRLVQAHPFVRVRHEPPRDARGRSA
jgi:hypothetical protein